MAYVRSKMINGHGPYYYLVKSVRQGKTVKQVHVRYIGKSPDVAPQPPPPGQEPPRAPYLLVEGAGERVETRQWSRLRRERAERIARTVRCNPLQADALAKAVDRLGYDPDTYDWDELQGKDLSYEDRLDRIEGRANPELATDVELKHAYETDLLERHEAELEEKHSNWHELTERRKINLAKQLERERLRESGMSESETEAYVL